MEHGLKDYSEHRALIFDIKRDCSEDGPGIRTTVFFKGCPLSCTWCQNPEGISNTPGLSFKAAACQPDKCAQQCVEVCPESCFHIGTESGKLNVNWEACTRCDRCFSVCPAKALEPIGRWITLDELLYRVLVDKPFYQSSGGGVTVSGGEAVQQMGFLHHFLKKLQQEGVHTALETSGFFNYRRFQENLLPHLDLIYFDLKLMDEKQSRQYTGQTNRVILNNFKQLLKDAQIPVVPRVPLIPGITTTPENLSHIARFLEENGIRSASLMPYNPLWRDKAEKIGKDIEYQRVHFMTEEEKDACVSNFYIAKKGQRRAGNAN